MPNLVLRHQLSVHSNFKKSVNSEPETVNHKGFTLIELLVVITIISVLTSIAYIAFKNSQDKGRDSRRKQDLKAIATALVSYYADRGIYPPTCSGPCLQARSSSDNGTIWIPNLDATYIAKLPTDPSQPTGGGVDNCAGLKKTYCYIALAGHKDFVLWAQLENPNDQEALGKSASTCAQIPPAAAFNYCVESPK